MYYHELHPAVYKELVWEKVGNRATVVSFTPGTAVFAQAALEHGNFPVLVCNNKAHFDWCKTTITDYVIAELKKGNDKITPPNMSENLKRLEPARLTYAKLKGVKAGKDEEKKEEEDKKKKEEDKKTDEKKKNDEAETEQKDDGKQGDNDYDYDYTWLGLLRWCRELVGRPY